MAVMDDPSPRTPHKGMLRALWSKGLPLRYMMLLVIVLGVAAPAAILLAVEQEISQQSQQKLLTQSKSAVLVLGTNSVAEPMWIIDTQALEEAAQKLLENPQVLAVRVEEDRPNATPIEATQQGFAIPPLTSAGGGRYEHQAQPVVRAGEKLGTLHVWFDTSFGKSILDQRRNQMVMLVSVQVTISLIVLMVIMTYRVLKPFGQLKQQATALVSNVGVDDQPQFNWQRQDEIGQLGRHLVDVQKQLAQLFGELEGKNHQLQELALYDQLTGLPNRSLFMDLVQREMLQARRHEQQFGIFFIDLDRFKAVNDSMGHAAGDELLKEVSRRLRTALREVDVVCRQSGDEFLVLTRDIENWEWLGDVAQRLLKVVEEPFKLQGLSANVSASIGISLFPDDADNFETLIKHADIAMYQAKALGRARYSFFHSELNERLQASLELEQQLGTAIAGGELVLHYQPQVDAATGRLVGVEALVRWQHPTRGLLYPGSFIGIAEESGKIADMGVWTLGTACAQMAAWKAKGIHVGCMAVNVSALEFRDHRLLDSLQTALSNSGILPGELEIEITESVLMTETETSQRIMGRMRELGLGIAIDDFGTGYSSLAYLKRLRPTQLKIDRSFVSDTENDADSRAIVRGVVGLAAALGLGTVAEGVETEEQARFLRECGCTTLQGYHISRPLPVEKLEEWIQAQPGA